MSNPAEKPTPGPWTQPYPWQVRLGPCQDPETPKCSVVVDLPLGHIADARLIAAAPDMLDALYRIDKFLAQTKPEGHRTMRDWLSAQIAKAEGGAS